VPVTTNRLASQEAFIFISGTVAVKPTMIHGYSAGHAYPNYFLIFDFFISGRVTDMPSHTPSKLPVTIFKARI
jgi:hypothetical protein